MNYKRAITEKNYIYWKWHIIYTLHIPQSTTKNFHDTQFIVQNKKYMVTNL